MLRHVAMPPPFFFFFFFDALPLLSATLLEALFVLLPRQLMIRHDTFARLCRCPPSDAYAATVTRLHATFLRAHIAFR